MIIGQEMSVGFVVFFNYHSRGNLHNVGHKRYVKHFLINYVVPYTTFDSIIVTCNVIQCFILILIWILFLKHKLIKSF